ncbi:MAG TPA: hypothetical protein VKP88_00195 [Candidatus Paceibacterota bacterium]|nr:hypothetical protein [Candidatus Paceibacterota bacterium]
MPQYPLNYPRRSHLFWVMPATYIFLTVASAVSLILALVWWLLPIYWSTTFQQWDGADVVPVTTVSSHYVLVPTLISVAGIVAGALGSLLSLFMPKGSSYEPMYAGGWWLKWVVVGGLFGFSVSGVGTLIGMATPWTYPELVILCMALAMVTWLSHRYLYGYMHGELSKRSDYRSLESNYKFVPVTLSMMRVFSTGYMIHVAFYAYYVFKSAFFFHYLRVSVTLPAWLWVAYMIPIVGGAIIGIICLVHWSTTNGYWGNHGFIEALVVVISTALFVATTYAITIGSIVNPGLYA